MDKKTRTTYKEPKFYLDKRPGKPAAIFLKYSYERGQRLSYFTGETIEPDKWNAETQRIKRNVTGGSGINESLDKLFEAAKTIVRDYRLQNKRLSISEFKHLLDVARGMAVMKTDFFSIYDQFISTESSLKAWTFRTNMKMKTLKDQLTAFQEHKRKKIDFGQINESFFQELVTFWQTKYKHRNSTISKNIHLLKWFLNWSYEKNHCSDQFKKVKIKLKETSKKVVFLDMTEIKAIHNTTIPENSYLDRTRDIFIFQCLTGLRFSDLKNLKATDRNGDSITVATIKTGENIEIELNETTTSIWNKYSEFQAATGKALPVPVNQVYNRFLKELAKLAGLVEPVTLVHYKGSQRIEETFQKYELVCTHSARRSFITNGLTLGIGSEVIRSWTGHKTDRAFAAYYEVVKQRKQKDMNKFQL
jgi:integrase